MHKDNSIKHIFLIILFSLLPLLSLFTTPDMVHTHDGPVHLARIAAYYKALVDGQFPPRWASELNYGYGTPVFIFLYPLPYYLGALFVALGSGLIAAFKLLLITSFLLSGIFMYLFIKELTGNKRSALLATLFYQFAPYRLVQLTVRGSMAEAFTFSFLPLALLGIVRLNKQPNYLNFLITAVGAAFLILSHNSISLAFFGMVVLFSFLFTSTGKGRWLSLAALTTGLSLSTFYWLPAILERKYTYGDLFMRDMYKTHLSPFYQFLLPNFTNDARLQTGGVSVQLGIFHVFAAGAALWILWKKKAKETVTNKLLWFGVVILGLSFFFMQPVSAWLWERAPLLRQFQFPWRLLAAASFATSLLSLSFLLIKAFQKPIVYGLLCALVVLSTAYYWRPPLGFDKINIDYFWNYPLNTTYFGEADVIWAAGPAGGYPKERVEIVSGKGVIENFRRRSKFHTFSLLAQTPVEIASHTLYFPGWRVYIDGKKAPIQFQHQNWRGLITFTVPPGIHEVKVVFRESKVRLIADVISVIATIGLLGGWSIATKTVNHRRQINPVG